jgi:hypothetical protein
VRRNNFGADCQVSNSRVVLYVDTAISRPAAEQNHKHIQIGGHDVLASDNNSASFCSFTARRALTADGNRFRDDRVLDECTELPASAAASVQEH